MKSEKEVEEMARKFVDKSFYFKDQFGGDHGLDQHEDNVATHSYESGYSQAQKDMIEEASGEFPEVFERFERGYEKESDYLNHFLELKEVFVAGRLSGLKHPPTTREISGHDLASEI